MQQLNPKAVWLFFTHTIALSIVLIIFSSGIISSIISEFILAKASDDVYVGGWLLVFIVIVVIFIIIAFVWAKLSYNNFRYELRDDGFRKESGVIYKKYTSIPYERIQNVDINRGILARILGLSDLQIQTAGNSNSYNNLRIGGGGAAEGRLPGLSLDVAEQLRDELIRRSKTVK